MNQHLAIKELAKEVDMLRRRIAALEREQCRPMDAAEIVELAERIEVDPADPMRWVEGDD